MDAQRNQDPWRHGLHPMPSRSDVGSRSTTSEVKPRPRRRLVVEYTKPRDWPAAPQGLDGSTRSAAWGYVVDGLLILKASIFLVVCILAVSVNGQPTGSLVGAALEQLAKLGPTLFPIAFAALAGRALKDIARYQAEKGIQLSSLYALLNSRTLWDVTVLPFTLRRASLLAANLTLLWALSPLGGQASLRLLYKTTEGMPTATIPLRYLDAGPLGHVRVAEGVIAASRGQNLPLSLDLGYSAALMQGVRHRRAAADAWGNVRVPRLEGLDASLADGNGWIEITGADRPEAFSSLIGLPVAGLPEGDTKTSVEFTFETAHVALACQPFELFDYTEATGTTPAINLTYGLRVLCEDCINPGHNLGGSLPNALLFAARSLSFLGVGSNTSAATDAEPRTVTPRTIQFQAGIGGAAQAIRSSCAVSQKAVEVSARCDMEGRTSPSCRAERVRQSPNYRVNENLTAFDYWATFALDGISAASQPRGNSSTAWTSASEVFLNDSLQLPDYGFSVSQEGPRPIDLRSIPTDLFELRASMLLNTYIQLFMAPASIGGMYDTNLPSYGVEHTPFNGPLVVASSNYWTTQFVPNSGNPPDGILTPSPFLGASTTGTLSSAVEIYKLDLPWLVILVIASCTVMGLGIAGLYLRTRTVGPDVFDPVVSWTYHNPDIKVAEGASTLGVARRIRLLADVRVSLGDVKGEAEVGKVGLGLTGNVDKLYKGKLYE